MAKFDIEKLISTHTKDGEVDYTKINEELETQNRNIVVKEASKEVEKLKGEQLTNLIKEIGVDGESIDDVKLYIKKMGGSTDEVKEENIKLTKELENLKTELTNEVESRTKIENEIKEKSQLELIKGLGVTDEKQIKFLKWDLSQQVSEDKTFEQVVAEYAKENEITTTTKIIKDQFGAQGDGKALDIGEAWKTQRAKTRR
jgi:hypothetical protein